MNVIKWKIRHLCQKPNMTRIKMYVELHHRKINQLYFSMITPYKSISINTTDVKNTAGSKIL